MLPSKMTGLCRCAQYVKKKHVVSFICEIIKCVYNYIQLLFHFRNVAKTSKLTMRALSKIILHNDRYYYPYWSRFVRTQN